MDIKESDLFPPLKKFFQDAGFEVDGEVKNCDLVAKKDEHIVIVELKKTFQLKLLYQAIDRQSLTEYVYVAIPRPPKGQHTTQWKNMLKILKRLELGLITVAIDSPVPTVEVLLEPSESVAWKNRKKREKLDKEFTNRKLKSTIGGTTKEKILTAYREKAIELLCILYISKKPLALKELREINIGKEYTPILSSSAYNWFKRVSKGVYTLSGDGKKAIASNEHKEIVEYYINKYRYHFK